MPSLRSRISPLGRDAWLAAARDSLIREGIAAVKIGRIARRLKVTRGGFYWFFASRQQLLDELLELWQRENTAALKAILQSSAANGMAEFRALGDVWIGERTYSPAWDAAVRDWARVSAKVARVVRRTDEERIRLMKRIFLDLGYADEEAFVRARICYFHQVGYYALGVRESRQERLRLLPLYTRVLTGRND
ncbi:MAG TPA: helix-turn-helix domain-containing protein [Steroidobacteraceae bacterium]